MDPASAEKNRRDEAKRKLLERLRSQKPVDIGPWTREELYEERTKTRKPSSKQGGANK